MCFCVFDLEVILFCELLYYRAGAGGVRMFHAFAMKVVTFAESALSTR